MKKILTIAYASLMCILPTTCDILLYNMEGFVWDTGKIILMSLLTFMGYCTKLFTIIFCIHPIKTSKS